MNEKQKDRIKKLYGNKDNTMSRMINPGIKFGNTTKSRLQQGSIKCLEDQKQPDKESLNSNLYKN